MLLEASKENKSNHNNCYSFSMPVGNWTEINQSNASCEYSSTILMRSNGEEIYKITFFPIIEEITHYKKDRHYLEIEIDINKNKFNEKNKETLKLIKNGGPYNTPDNRRKAPKRYLNEMYTPMESIISRFIPKKSFMSFTKWYEAEFFIYTIDELSHKGNYCNKIYGEFISPKVGKTKFDKTLKGFNLKDQVK